MFIRFIVKGNNNSMMIGAIIARLSNLLPVSTFYRNDSECWELSGQEWIGYDVIGCLYVDTIAMKRLLNAIIANMDESVKARIIRISVTVE